MTPKSDLQADVDQDLLLARAGDQEALGRLLEYFRDYLQLVAADELYSGVRPKVGASDAVQQTLHAAVRGFSAFRGDSEPELRAWLRQILDHQMIDLARSFRQARRNVARERALNPLPTVVDPPARDATPSKDACDKEQRLALLRAIEQLPTDYRVVIVMRSLEEKSFQEMGAALGRSSDAVRMLWTRAVERLRVELERSHG
ncbi:MAG: sigma-70 family RNA polymerase sigma factor [Pirellulales bacterium]|nr:sigma-70 family RNA polymerase sigma factor [Pirellulales bacterium]